MKPLLLATLALTATSVAGEALAQSGELGLTYKKVDGGAGGGYDGFGVSGSGVMPLRGRFSIQLDVDATQYESEDGLADATVFGALAHFHMRDAGWTGGVFLGGSDGDDVAESYAGGYEHYLFYKHITLGGAVGYFSSSPVDTEAAYVQLETRVFPIPSLRFDISGALASIETMDDSGGQDADGSLYTVGIGAEYKIPKVPVSLFANVAHGELDARDAQNDSFRLGVRLMTAATLLERDRKGSSLMSLPAFQDYLPPQVVETVIDPLAPAS